MYYDAYYTYVVVFPQQGGWFSTTIPAFQNMLLTACQTGNWLAVYITDGNYDWDQLYTYDY